MNRLLLALVIPLLVLAAGPAFSQEADSVEAKPRSIVLKTRIKDGKVQLRWFPGSAAAWRMANGAGYTVERMPLDEGDDVRFVPVSPAPFKPLAKAEWDTRPELQEDFAKAARDAIFSAPTSPKGRAGFDQVMRHQNDENGVFYSFMLGVKFSPGAAAAAGLFFEDPTAQPGKAYAYRIYIRHPKAGNTDTAKAFVSVTAGSSPAPVVEGLEVEEGDGFVILRWDYEQSRRHFVAYNLERSIDGGKTFTQVNRYPILFSVRGASEASYTDSVPNYRLGLYRVTGITAFGDAGAPSVALRGTARDKTPPAPATGTQAVGDVFGVSVTWDLKYMSPDLRGFIVARSTGSDGPFRLLNETPLPKEARRFTDAAPNAIEPYYIVYALDTAGNYSNAFSTLAQITDSVPPAAPVALTGSIDSLGSVMLSWKANEEADLAGYNIYVANAKDNVYRQLNGAPHTAAFFTDSVSMQDLNRSIYYKITALDHNNNPSPYSQVLELRRPDVILPAAPVFQTYRVEEGNISLAWIPSASKDVKEARLTRQESETRKTVGLKIGKLDTAYTDRMVEVGKTYTYTLVALDSAGHAAASEPLAVRVYDNGVRQGIADLRAEWKSDDRAASLSWKYKVEEGKFYYLVYRGESADALTPYKKVVAGTSRAMDSDVPDGGAYYAVKVLYADGGESELSEAVKLSTN